MYQPRTYRNWVKDKDLVSFTVTIKETDLYIRASSMLKSKAARFVLKYRKTLEKYIESHSDFLTSLKPLSTDEKAPKIVQAMLESTKKAGVGPMASVAGAIAEFVGKELLEYSPEVIVENGGDIYIKTFKKRVIGIYAGNSTLSGKIGLEIKPEDTPLGICTSSGTVGHSLSFGKADAVVTLSTSATLADAAATAIGNIIKKPVDFPAGLELAENIEGLTGLVIIKDDKVGVWGKAVLCKIDQDNLKGDNNGF